MISGLVLRWRCLHFLLLLLSLCFNNAQCHKILIYNPRLAHSHVNFFGRIADILVEAGHDVVTYVVEGDPDVKTNGTKLSRIILGAHLPVTISMKDLTKNIWNEEMEDLVNIFKVALSIF
ncbi:unnamed protein product [Gongylonema pulchrum]|uniref:Glucuronosyltransferase n=1 Tax=Gongylonema pulchrum TaxID=637853 RepID=A0A183DFB5_9BILA|nr:unnamed protein product [Gongylonema pulchrum]